MRTLSFAILLLIFLSLSCTSKQPNNMDNSTIVRIETSLGNIDLMLYDETPAHRDNFIKLINEGFYDDLLFHRVINNFMIQTGDPESRDALPGMQIGTGETGYTIPPEIHSHLFHKKGALAAARLSDDVNPERNSSGSQFYIVHGLLFDDAQLDELEARTNYHKKQEFASKLFRELEREYIDKEIQPDYQEISERVKKIAPDQFDEKNLFKFSNEVVTNAEFSKMLARILKRPCGFKIPAFLLRLIFGEASVLLTEGAEVVPGVLVESGFTYKYSSMDSALRAALSK